MTLFYVNEKLHNPHSTLTETQVGDNLDIICGSLLDVDGITTVDAIASGIAEINLLVGVKAETESAADDLFAAALDSAFASAGLRIQAEQKQFALARA